VKPLFIPLKKEYFEAFERGEKKVEYRAYGARWNENVCVIGRPVVLSCGYGKARRLKGKVVSFMKTKVDKRKAGFRPILALFKSIEHVAEIGIKIDTEADGKR